MVDRWASSHNVRPMLYPRTALVVTLALLGGLTTAPGAERYLTLALEASIEPTRTRVEEGPSAIGSSVSTSTDTVSRGYRIGALGLWRMLPDLPICPTFGASVNKVVIDDTTTTGESTTTLLTTDLMQGVSWFANDNVIIDVLAFGGYGPGSTTATISPGTTYNPDATLREFGGRANLTFISARGWTLMAFTGYKRMILDEKGTLNVSGGASTPWSRTSIIQGMFVGVDWGFSF